MSASTGTIGASASGGTYELGNCGLLVFFDTKMDQKYEETAGSDILWVAFFV